MPLSPCYPTLVNTLAQPQGPVKVRKVPPRGTRSLAVGETDGQGGATAAVRFL